MQVVLKIRKPRHIRLNFSSDPSEWERWSHSLIDYLVLNQNIAKPPPPFKTFQLQRERMPKCEVDSKTIQGFTGSNQQRRTIKDCLIYSATNGSLLYCIVYLALIFKKNNLASSVGFCHLWQNFHQKLNEYEGSSDHRNAITTFFFFCVINLMVKHELTVSLLLLHKR